MTISRTILCTCLCLLLTACDHTEQKAAQQLQVAREAFAQGRYDEAKLHIDSIKQCYPKAFDARRAGIALMQDIGLAEQDKTLHYLDSLLHNARQAFEQMKDKFVFEKDKEYQQLGLYLHPSQVIERNLHRAYLRFQTDEKGRMTMTSVYCGKQNIHHKAIKVSTPDNLSAQTPDAPDCYETSDMGERIERADFRLGQDGSVIDFIRLNKDRNIRVTYLGERTFTTQMTAADRQAAAQVYELSRVLETIARIEADMDQARTRKQYLLRKKEEARKDSLQ